MRKLCILACLIFIAGKAFGIADTSTDPRLDKKVTLEVSHTKLEDVVRSLADQTGVVIKAGSGQRDWRVRERKVTIYAKDVPAGQMMTEISKLLGYYLSQDGKEGEWTYLFWQDQKSRIFESEMITAEKEAAAQRIKDMRQGALDEAAKALDMSPEDALKQRDKNPWQAYLGGTQSGRGFAQLMSLFGGFPTERELMLRGQRTSIPLSNLSPGMQLAVTDASGFNAFTQMSDAEKEKLKALTPYQLTVMPVDQIGDSMASLVGFGGLMFITGLGPGGLGQGSEMLGGGIPMGFLPLAGPDSIVGNMFGKTLLALSEGATREEAMKQMQEPNRDTIADALKRKSPTEENPPTDPELTREVELDKTHFSTGLSSMDKPEANGKMVEAISKAIGMPVLLESFRGFLPLEIFLKPGKQPLYQILIGIEKAGDTWDMQDKTLRIRPEDWALQRSYEIQDSFIAYCKDLLEKQGEWTLDDAGYIAVSLTDDQIQNTLARDPDLSMVAIGLTGGSLMGGSRDVIRTYGLLTPQQKTALKSDAGLPFAEISDQQWEYLNPVLADRLNGAYATDGYVRLKPESPAEKEKQFQRPTFEFTVQTANEEKPRVFTVSINLLGKEQLAGFKAARKKALEDAEKAKAGQSEQKPSDQPPTPSTQPQPAPK